MKRKKLIELSMFLLLIVTPIAVSVTYNEKITKPSITDNDYAIAVSNFIKEKCGNCKDVMIIGDDFVVVPHYRNEVPVTEGYSAWGIVDWFEDRISKPIYTDSGFIQRKYDFTISDLKEMENRAYFILPDGVNSELRNAINELELTIQNKFNVTVREKQGNEVNCDDVQYFDSFNDASLFIIGDRETNPSLKCYPFVELEENMITVQPNIWDSAHLFDDSKSFAVIINSMNQNITINVDYIFKNDIYLDINRQSAILEYALLGVGAVGAGAVIIGAVTVGSPVLIIGGVILAGTSIANECVIKNAGGDNWGWCGFDAVFTVVGGKLIEIGFKASMPIVKWTVRNTLGKLGDTLIVKYGDEFLSFSYDLIKKGKYKSFVKALNNGRHYVDDIFNFFRKNVLRFDDAVAKGTTKIDDIPLSEGGTYIKNNARNPISTASEIISFENFYKRGMAFLKGENGVKAVQYQSGFNKQPVEFIGKMGDEKVAVQVKRVFDSKNPLTVDESKGILERGLDELNEGLTKVVPADKWERGVVHAIIKESDREIVESAIKTLDPQKVGDNQIVITIVEDVTYIWS